MHDRPSDSFDAVLPAQLDSAVVARRLLARACAAWKVSEAAGADAALALSELVTNSVLHAGTTVHVCIRRLGIGLRLEVGDGSRQLPVVDAARPEDLLKNRSMTGRGLALIAAMCDRWGADPTPEGGKVTWAEVGTGRRLVSEEPAPAFPPDPGAPRIPEAARARGVVSRQAVAGGGRRVHLVGVPVQLILESTRQLSDLQRELQVIALAGNPPPELEQVIQSGRPWTTDIDQWASSDRRTAEHAEASGAETVDFEVVVPDDIAGRIEGIATWLHRAMAAIPGRQLLTLPATREVSAYRRWYGEEVMRQLSGAPPRPFTLRTSQPT